MAGIFKAYDIRGIYPDELDDDTAHKIGLATGRLFDRGTVVVGHDMREVAIPVSEALVEGLRESGQDVIDIGLCSTPMNYSAIGHFEADGGVMVTASHNPSEYIGFKLSRDNAKPVSYETGINEIERMVESGDLSPGETKGRYENISYLDEYTEAILEYAEDVSPLNIAIDTGNGMGGLTVPEVYNRLPVNVKPMYFELDGSFPNHTPNPIEEENMRDLQETVRSGDYDLGMAFDGDGDRVAFVDEDARIIPSDRITALLCGPILEKFPDQSIVYDLRSSRVVPEEIQRNGGTPVRHRVGHAYMKAKMREMDAPFGGELSGHYYFRENYYTDSGIIASIYLLNHLSDTDKPLSELIEPFNRYAQSGEINFRVKQKQEAMEALASEFDSGEVDWLDGVTVQFEDWWFNVRPSNTEPYLRLNLEAEEESVVESRTESVRTVIEDYVSS